MSGALILTTMQRRAHLNHSLRPEGAARCSSSSWLAYEVSTRPPNFLDPDTDVSAYSQLSLTETRRQPPVTEHKQAHGVGICRPSRLGRADVRDRRRVLCSHGRSLPANDARVLLSRCVMHGPSRPWSRSFCARELEGGRPYACADSWCSKGVDVLSGWSLRCSHLTAIFILSPVRSSSSSFSPPFPLLSVAHPDNPIFRAPGSPFSGRHRLRMSSPRNQYFQPLAEWSIDDVPDQSGKVFLITGGTSGLGTSDADFGRDARHLGTQPTFSIRARRVCYG